LAFLLAACGITPPPDPAAQGDNGYLLTVPVSSTDTAEALTHKFGGKVIAWQPKAGFAILQLSTVEAQSLRSSPTVALQSTTLEPNTEVEAPDTEALGYSAWADGYSAWADGTGSLPVLPSTNRPAFMQIKLPQAQAMSWNYGLGVTVAVIDTGLDLNHPAFQGRLAPSAQWKDYVDGDNYPQEVSGSRYGHGTAVAGLILQVAPKAKILPIRVLRPTGSGNMSNVISAISYAVSQGARVINLSLGTKISSSALQTMLNYATSNSVFVIASAGNTGDSSMSYPAALAKTANNSQYVISIGSISKDDDKSIFSCDGKGLELYTPGEQLYSAYPGGQVARFTGTSFAAPLVTGGVALMLGDGANPGSVEGYLTQTAQGLRSGKDNAYGIMNLLAASQKAPGARHRMALLVVGNPTLSSADSVVKSRLESLGYTVSVVGDLASSSADAAGKELVVISSTVGSTNVGSKFRDVAVPVVVWENSLYDDMKMTGTVEADTGDEFVATGVSQLSISSTHPLAAGLTDKLAVYTSNDDMAWGRPSSGAVRAATLTSDSSKAVIFGYNQGAAMVGMTAPARRVGFFLRDLGASKWTTQGAQLFEAAVTWAVTGN
jgi:subtilisin family serine protease